MVKKYKKFFITFGPIFLIWIIGLFFRCYRQSELLGFYYDQGRDAQIASDIITLKNFPAIGPTTGIEGLFLGPFWFYLITPGYLIGGGDPAFASLFIAFLESLSIPLIFYLLKTYWRLNTAYFASFLWAFSHYLIRSARWFSNPSPLPTVVIMTMILLLKIFKDKKYYLLPYLSLLIGISLQLEAASAIFFIPTILIYFLTQLSIVKKIKPKSWFLSILAFIGLLLPQIAFEIKNNFLISRNFIGFLGGKVNSDTGQSWAIPNLDFLAIRLKTYYESFFSKLDTNLTIYSYLFLVVFGIGLIILLINHRRHLLINLQLLWLLVPLILLLFFVGNYGNLYDYYLTGFFPAFIILFSIIITLPKSKILLIILISASLVYFSKGNFIHLRNYISAGFDGPLHITLGNQLSAVKLACSANDQERGNIDYYVPPVIPHAYTYLVGWQQRLGLCHDFDSQKNPIVYIIYEVDPPHPERLKNWLQKYQQDQILEETHIGGVVFQKLKRFHP